jgi:hypothetical protein
MSFWTNSTGKQVTSDGTYETNNFEVLPNNTIARARIDECGLKEWEGSKYLSIRWHILGGEFDGRKIFQSLSVYDADPKNRDKAINMLAAIDANSGGKLPKDREPTDEDYMLCLMNRIMLIKVIKYKSKKDGEYRNLVCKVSSANNPTEAMQVSTNEDEDIPW